MRARADHMQALAEHGHRAHRHGGGQPLPLRGGGARRPARALEELIENIDIGGPTMIRAAAKNYQDVAVVVSPADYAAIVEEMRANGGALSLETRWRLAKKAFRTTADYDAAISARLEREDAAGPLPPDLSLRAPKLMDLRYGENPHQAAALYGAPRPGRRRRRATARQGAFLQQPGGSGRGLATGRGVRRRRPSPSSSTPTRAAAPSRIRWRKLPQGPRVRPGLGLRRRDRLQPRRWTKRPRARSPRRSSRPSPRPTMRPKRWPSCEPRRTCGSCAWRRDAILWW